ncbi:MAG TPA: MFS transporter, partial [Bacilli bacterium]|nr:MFS transporter [Bacilli bacterium]
MRSSRWTLFRNRSFLFYWLGYLLSHVGDSVFLIAAAWLVADVTGSGWMMGAYFMCLGIPRVLLMLVGGVFVDRMEPRTWMLLSDGLRGVVMILFYLLIVDGTPSVWGLYVIAVLFGTVDAVYWPAANKLRQRVVARENYSQANGVLVGSMQMAMIAGPVLGAALLALGGTGLAVLFNGISFFVSALTL